MCLNPYVPACICVLISKANLKCVKEKKKVCVHVYVEGIIFGVYK